MLSERTPIVPDEEVGFWVTGDEPSKERKIHILRYMSELIELGFGIIPTKPKQKFRKGHRVHYQIARLHQRGARFLRQIPFEHHVDYDLSNKQIQLIGPNAGFNKTGPWIQLIIKRETQKKQRPKSIFEIRDNIDEVMQDFSNSIYGTKRREFIHIKELPFMVLDDGGIACIPQFRNEPRIGWWGISGFGKSMSLHGLMDRAYWRTEWDIHLAHMNDVKPETHRWCMPTKDFVIDLKRLNEIPRPLPTVYLHPKTKDNVEIINEEDQVGYKISLPFEEVIKDFDKYFEDMKGTSKYFGPRRKDFLKLENPTVDNMIELFMNKGTDEQPVPKMLQPPHGCTQKLRAILEDMKDKQILDVWTGIPSKWKIKSEDLEATYNPITACLLVGLVPVFVTNNLVQKGYAPQYFQYFASDIFNRQYEDPLFRKNKVKTWLVIDEILHVSKKGKKSYSSEALEQCQTEGRQRRIGTLVATQNYSQVQDRIKTNCNFIMAFNMGPESSKLCNDYSIDRSHAKRLKKLRTFEAMAYAIDEYFIVYDSDGKRERDRGPLFGKMLKPLSQHSAPV